jgi:broad specificity phosphatase PhoE
MFAVVRKCDGPFFMPTLYLIRHAKPAAGWGEDLDPGLDPTGHAQAQATADVIATRTDALPILTSPMKRCRETAFPLERAWSSAASIFPAVAEIPAPPLGLAERRDWLVKAMAGTWRELQDSAPPHSPDFLTWHADLLAAVQRIPEPAIIYSHFIAINAIVGAAHGSDNVVCFRPDHASMTVIDTDSGSIRIVELGREAITNVLART